MRSTSGAFRTSRSAQAFGRAVTRFARGFMARLKSGPSGLGLVWGLGAESYISEARYGAPAVVAF